MKHLPPLLLVLGLCTALHAQTIKRSIPYAGVDDEKRSLDVYAPAGAKDLPVAFWIHGGGWHGGDKADVKIKPQAFMDKGFVFVSVKGIPPSCSCASLPTPTPPPGRSASAPC